MVTFKISDQSKKLQEVSPEWIRSTISKNRVMGKDNRIEINIESENANLVLFANCEQAGTEKASNDIENRIVFHWNNLVLSQDDLDPGSIYDFLKKMDHWVSFVPEE